MTCLTYTAYSPLCYLLVSILLILMAGCESSTDSKSTIPIAPTQTGQSAQAVQSHQSTQAVQSDSNNRPSNRLPKNGLPGFDSSTDRITASEILAKVINRYATAKNYRDQAVLHLDYRLNEKRLKEPHRFSVSWTLKNQLSARLFKTHLQSDGNLMSCYLYDIESGNLDGQQTFLAVEERLPLEEIFDDSIALHYLGGYADLPLDEQNRKSQPKLIPPTLALLTGQLGFGWIQQPEKIQRLSDETIDGKRFYALRSQFCQMSADIWIDSETYLLQRISMPLKLMDRQVLIAREIADVELMIRFHDAEIDFPETGNDTDTYRVGLKKNARPVQRFVSIPISFPSNKVGQLVPSFQLQTSRGKVVNHLNSDGRTTLLLWLPNGGNTAVNQTIVSQLNRLQDTNVRSSDQPMVNESVEIGLIYAEEDLVDPQSSTLLPHPDWAELAVQKGYQLFFDQGLRTFQQFELQGLPAAVVIGKQGKTEYVRLFDMGDAEKTGWIEDIQAALYRIEKGENVASEMLNDYQQFIDRYHQQLLSVSAIDLITQIQPTLLETESQHSASALAANRGTLSTVSPVPDNPNSRLKPVLAWQIDLLRQPGNAYSIQSPNQLSWYVFDGWRTIVQIDSQGMLQQRISLDLPEQVAVTKIEMLPSPTESSVADPQAPAFAAWGKMGKQVYLFNRRWERIAEVPEIGFEHDGIADVQWIAPNKSILQIPPQQRDRESLSTSDDPQLLILFANGGGCYLFNRQQRTMELVSREPAESIAWADTRLALSVADQLIFIPQHKNQLPVTARKKFQDLVFAYSPTDTPIAATKKSLADNQLPIPQVSQSCRLVATFMDPQHKWYVGGVSISGSIQWQQPIGIQLFESQIAPLAGILHSNGTALFAIADGNRWVTFLSGDGNYLGQVAARSTIQGISLGEFQGESYLLLSLEQAVECYRLSQSGVGTIRTSTSPAQQSARIGQ